MKNEYAYALLVAAILIVGIFAGLQTSSLEQARSNLSASVSQVQERDLTISSLSQQATSLQVQISGLNSQVYNLTGQLLDLTSERDLLRSQLAAAQATVASQSATLSSLDLNTVRLNSEVFELQNNLTAANVEIEILQGQLAAANLQLTTLQSQLDAVNSQASLLQAQLDSMTTQRNNYYNISSLNVMEAFAVNQSFNIPANSYGYFSFNTSYAGVLHAYFYSNSSEAYVELKYNFTKFGQLFAFDYKSVLGKGAEFVFPVLPGPLLVEIHPGNSAAMTGNISLYYWY
jgi:peptidoglycan hydrolase CwlO-like protein